MTCTSCNPKSAETCTNAPPRLPCFFPVFYALPDWLGLSLWNLLKVLVLLTGIFNLPRLVGWQEALLALFLFYLRKLQSALYVAGWTIVLLLVPLLFIDVQQYIPGCTRAT